MKDRPTHDAARAALLPVFVAASLAMLVQSCAAPGDAAIDREPAEPTSFEGWDLAGSTPGDYEVGHADGAAVLRSRAPTGNEGFGTLMQLLDAERYRGHRVRFSAEVEAFEVDGWAGLWMRVDGAAGGRPFAFDNMEDRAIRGTRPSARYEVVLDVDPRATAIAFGVLLAGSGEVRVRELALDVVGDDVPITSAPAPARERSASPANLGFEEARAGDDREAPPAGWFPGGASRGDYSMRRDLVEPHGGSASARIEPRVEAPAGFGTLMQSILAAQYVGRRVRLRASVRGVGVDGWAGLWMRTDAGERNGLTFDNMQDRPLRGTFDWHEVAVVLDVPEQADVIAFGVLLRGGGTVWVDDVVLEVVGDDVPSTSLVSPLPDEPRNLELRPAAP